MEQHPQTSTPTRLAVGEFAPVFWEPLGKRGERLVVGVLVCDPNGICKAHPTLQHKQLVQYLEESKTESAAGVMDFTFSHFNKTLSAGGTIQDLKVPFARMSIGRTEAISARTDDELTQRAIQLCTLLGRVKIPDPKTKTDNTTARTRKFISEVRQVVRTANPTLAKVAMGSNMRYPIGSSEIRLHFHVGRLYAQFCSLPLPNARPEAATECQARLNDLMAIRQTNPNADVALWMNTKASQYTPDFQGKKNATEIIHGRTLALAKTFDILVMEYATPAEAARVIGSAADQAQNIAA